MLRKLFIYVALFSSPLFAQLTPTLKQTTRYSVRELEDWLMKQDRPNYVIPASYTIGGQVSEKWQNVHETLNGAAQVGSGTGTSSNQFKTTVELQITYALGRTFGDTRLQFANQGGAFNGTANSISLNRALIGYHFITYGPHTLDALAGRHALNKIYNSQMMFKTPGDGVTGMGYYIWKKVVEYQLWGGVYTSRPGSFWVVRGRLFNIANLGFYIDYDYVYWGKVKPSSNLTRIRTNYGISQFLVGWDRTPEWLGKNIQVFAALLYNNRAKPHPLSDNKLLNLAGYVGAQVGATKNQGDFSIQGQLQFCQLQALPEWDMAGIGRGNAGKGSLFKASTIRSVNGNTNFQGYSIKLNYALTKQVTITGDFKRSVNLNDGIGWDSSYTNYSISTAYSF